LGLFSKNKNLDNLDIPPPPPLDAEVPRVDSIPDLDELPPLPNEQYSDFEAPKMPEPIKMPEIKDDLDSKPIQGLPEIQQPISKEAVKVPNEVPELETPKNPISQAVEIETPIKTEKKIVPRDVFVDINMHSIILENLEFIKSSNSGFTESFERLNTIKNNDDKTYEKLHVCLEDMERKLLYVDKILFD
jgi:hypothetical protein